MGSLRVINIVTAKQVSAIDQLVVCQTYTA